MLFIHDDLMPMILIKEVRGNQKILLLWDPKLKQNENSTTSQPPYLITGISGFCHVPLFLFLALLIYLQTKVHLLSKVCVLLMLHMVYTICHTPWVINRHFPPSIRSCLLLLATIYLRKKNIPTRTRYWTIHHTWWHDWRVSLTKQSMEMHTDIMDGANNLETII